MNRKRARDLTDFAISKFRIKGKNDSPVESLSGGNQQRVLLSFLPEAPTLLLLENPTRGLDLDSANWVWNYLHEFAKTHNTAIVFSSAELDDIMAVADRVMVFFDGTLLLDTPTDATTPEALGSAIAGRVDADAIPAGRAS